MNLYSDHLLDPMSVHGIEKLKELKRNLEMITGKKFNK